MWHKPKIWEELEHVVNAVDAQACKTKVSKERRTIDRVFYSPKDMNAAFKAALNDRGWSERVTRYFVTDDELLILRTMHMTASEQKAEILAAGKSPIASYNQTDFVKDRIELEVQFGKYSFGSSDLLGKFLIPYARRVIDVGIAILPTQAFKYQLYRQLVSYETTIGFIRQEGRNSPPMPVVVIGVEP